MGVSIRFGVDVGLVATLVGAMASVVCSVGFGVSLAGTAVGCVDVGTGVVEGVTPWRLAVQLTVVMVMMMRVAMASHSHRAWWLRGRLVMASRMLRSGIVSP